MTERSPLPRVAVVSGGPSEEHEVSLASGAAVADALERERYPVRRVVIDGLIDPLLGELARDAEVVFVALHGRYGEDGTVQASLEGARIPYTGSGPAASRTAMCKPEAKRFLEATGIPTPKYDLVGRRDAAGALGHLRGRGLGLPLVVKPTSSGSSIGVSIVRDAGTLAAALGGAHHYGDDALVEEYVAGRELSVAVLDGQALPVLELLPAREFYDYEAKYTDEATRIVCPAPLAPEVRRRVCEAALGAFNAVGARDFGRVDLILAAGDVPLILEVNTIPGFTSHSLVPRAALAAGIGFGELVGRIVALAARRGPSGSCRKGDNRWSSAPRPGHPR